MSDAPNPASENAEAEPRDLEGLDAAAEAFANLGNKEHGEDQQPEDDHEAENESDDESAEEADEADPDADEESEGLVELEIGGKTYKVPEEVKKGHLRQADYSRAMNEVSAKEKALTERLESVKTIGESAEKYADALAGIKVIEAEIAALGDVDWDRAMAGDAAESAKAARIGFLQKAAQNKAAEAQNISESLGTERQKLLQGQRQEMFKTLEKSIKGWGDELGAKLTEYATKNGVSFKTLAETVDPGVVIALDKARRYDELQASKQAIKAKAKDAPQVVKPGAPRKADPKSDAMTRLRKSNSLDDAAAAFLARGR